MSPRDLDAPPRELLAELARHVGESTASDLCAELLSGADPHDHPNALAYLAGRPAAPFLAGTWGPDYWARVWGARGLLYVWSDDATDAVVAGLSDSSWRVAEMCLKVAAEREIAMAGDAAVRLAGHELPRVRGAAVRALGRIGDTDHLHAVRAACDDADADTRGHADRALARMIDRLDLPDRLDD